jgi:hypothetical protein
VLAQAATRSTRDREVREASDTFVSLFTIYLSGTHATIEQRLGPIERLIRSGERKQRSLGLAALNEVLEATHFSSSHRFDFGARSRDFGYRARSGNDVTHWYGAALALIERLALHDRELKPELRKLLGQNFRGLWVSAHMHDELEGQSRRFAADGFWREGWMACRQTMRFDKDRLDPDSSSRLAALEAELRPSNLPERVRAVVLGDRSDGLDLEDLDLYGDITSEFERLEAIARELGASVAADDAVFADLLPELVRGGNRAWAFGRGLAAGSLEGQTTWVRLVEGLKQLPPEQRNVQVLRGFLAELWDQDRELAQALLDTVLDEPSLAAFLLVLQAAVQIDARGVERLKQALGSGEGPVWMYRNLAVGRTIDDVAGSDLKDLLLLIADQPDGFDVALEVLYMRLYSDNSAQRPHEPEILEAGRELLRHIRFGERHQGTGHTLAGVVRACLTGTGAGTIAADVAKRLRKAVANYETYAFDNDDLLKALLSTQPTAVLDALFEGDERDQRLGVSVFDHLHEHRSNPADKITREELIAWCDRDPERRYALAASIVTFARSAEEGGSQVWSEHAEALLSSAPEPRNVLAVFLERFRPMSWSGSRAALMEANARLLDSLDSEAFGELMSFVAEAKELLAQEITTERQRETQRDQARDERFE